MFSFDACVRRAEEAADLADAESSIEQRQNYLWIAEYWLRQAETSDDTVSWIKKWSTRLER